MGAHVKACHLLGWTLITSCADGRGRSATPPAKSAPPASETAITTEDQTAEANTDKPPTVTDKPSTAGEASTAIERPTEDPLVQARADQPIAPDRTVIKPCGQPPPGMACIQGGPFVRGSNDGPDNTHPQQVVWLQTFYMDLVEVTYADYKACQKAKDCLRGGPLYNDFSRPQQPITGPSWYAAVKYCEVQGKHLPTEAQWEKAARGPDGALHPWGDEPATCERAVIKDQRGRSCGVLKRKEHPTKGRPFVVGTRPAGVYGLFDMSGNVWEWVYDWAAKDYAACGQPCQGTDPQGPCDGKEPCRGHTERVVRGGSWYWDKRYATAIYRRTHVPGNDPFHHFGFRCAASLEEGEALAASGGPAQEPDKPAN